MTKKQKILISISSVLLAIVILLVILFNAVFVLRKQTVSFFSEADELQIKEHHPELTNEDIIKAANLKLNKSIFSQDTDQATMSIEKAYPYVKVSSISATNVNEIDFQLKARYEMFSYFINEQYYILDEELKVLNITDALLENQNNLIKINPIKNKETQDFNNKLSEDFLNIKDLEAGDFANRDYKNIFSTLYESIYKYVTINKDEDPTYLDRDDIQSLISELSFKVGYAYEHLILKISYPQTEQNYEYTLDIGKPNDRLEYKIRVCFSVIPALLADETLLEGGNNAGGTIKFLFDEKGKDSCCYFDKENKLIRYLTPENY